MFERKTFQAEVIGIFILVFLGCGAVVSANAMLDSTNGASGYVEVIGIALGFGIALMRHRRTKGNRSRAACLTMVFKLCEPAPRAWRTLNGAKLLPEAISGTQFVDGEKTETDAA